MPLKDLLKLPLDLDHPDAPALMDGPVAQQWRLNGNPSAKSFTMANFVTMLGGEYFFAPSPQFLASL
jgi:hypothetical protein